MKRFLAVLAIIAAPLIVLADSASAATGQGGGYWMLSANGEVYGFGAAEDLGSPSPSNGRVHVTGTKTGNGYWVLSSDGSVAHFGDAANLGSGPAQALGESYTTMTATPSGNGYWLFTNKGRVLPFGDAPFLGDASAVRLNGPVLDAVVTPSGDGYYMVASDGGIFTYGDAAFRGSMGGTKLNKPVMSMAPDADGDGYWLVASDGGIFAFNALYFGSTGNLTLNKPISGIVASPTGGGYLMVAQDGGIFSFGDVPFYGSLGATPPASPVVSVAAFSQRIGFGNGTYLIGADIAPGTYRTVGAPDGCYWARLRGTSGGSNDIIANDFGSGWNVVTIAPTDLAFKTSGCGTWTPDLKSVTQGTSFGPGTLIVGLDLNPGTYRSSGGDGCYWARLSGFGGNSGEIIANDFTSGGQQTVTIAPSDVGFKTSGCGDWTKIA
jgi:hypothetical protein